MKPGTHLLLCLNHERVFCYGRRPEATDDTQIEVFADRLATTFRVGSDLRPREILKVHIEADPRHLHNKIVRETITLYNNLAISFSNVPTIRIQSYLPHRATV